MPMLSPAPAGEPLTSVPPTATAISSATAITYSGSATRARRCGAMLAIAHISKSAKPSDNAWLVRAATLWSDAAPGQHGPRDLRLFGRRIGCVPRMIAQAFIDSRRIALALQRVHLRGAGLA